jgi:hypothetical protein
LAVAVTVGGCVTTMGTKVPHPTPCHKWIRLLTESATIVYARFCVAKFLDKLCCVVPFVENNPRWKKKELLQVVPLKMDRFVTRKRDSDKCENNINQKKPVRAGPSQVMFLKIGVLLL